MLPIVEKAHGSETHWRFMPCTDVSRSRPHATKQQSSSGHDTEREAVAPVRSAALVGRWEPGRLGSWHYRRSEPRAPHRVPITPKFTRPRSTRCQRFVGSSLAQPSGEMRRCDGLRAVERCLVTPTDPTDVRATLHEILGGSHLGAAAGAPQSLGYLLERHPEIGGGFS